MFIPNNNKTNHPTPKKLNESVHIQLTVMLHCLYARLPQYTPNGKLDKCCERWPKIEHWSCTGLYPRLSPVVMGFESAQLA